jgi:hypothetical protein
MKKILIASIVMAATVFTSCKKETTTVTVDPAKPDGAFTVTKTGSLVAQNGTPTQGTIELGTDSKGTTFLHLGSNFTTELGTGTATVYLSKTMTYSASPGTGNPDLKLAGIVTGNGEAWYKFTTAPSATLGYVIIWCGSASIPFGNGKLN